jgi:hypothetical protein
VEFIDKRMDAILISNPGIGKTKEHVARDGNLPFFDFIRL